MGARWNMNADTKQTVREFIAANFLFRQALDAVGETESLIEAGLIDSTGVLELVSFLETQFPIAIADEDIVPENLDSIAAIAAYVERKLAERCSTQPAA